jgi:hypothetical protein
MIETAPPVTTVASPALIVIRPPAVNFPLPTTTLTLPPVPFVAEPVRNVMLPLLPFVVDPDVSDRDPDVPSWPLFAVRTLNAPLEVARP